MGVSPFGNPHIWVDIELDPLEYDTEDMPVFKARVKRACEQTMPNTHVAVTAGQKAEITDGWFSRKVV